MHQRRHVPLGRRKAHFSSLGGAQRAQSQMAHRRGLRALYASDQADSRHGGRFRWLVSTVLAAAVAAVAIIVVIAGSTDSQEMDGGILPTIQRMREARDSARRVAAAKVDGLRWAVPKTDRLMVPTGAMATKFIILDAVRQRKGNRDYIMNKPYARIAARLAPLSKADAQRVPPLNPFKLYASNAPLDQVGRPETQQDAVVKVVEQFGSLFPAEDGQELSPADITDIVARFLVPDRNSFDAADRVAGGELLADRAQRAAADIALVNTSVLQKSSSDSDDGLDEEGREVRIVKIQRSDTISRVLSRLGAEPWQARAMTDAARSIFQEKDLAPGMEMHVTLVPSVTRANRMDPARYTIFGEGREHKVTVTRDAAGDFVASATPIDRRIANTEGSDDEQGSTSSLYASLYQTAERQGVAPDVIMQVLKVHAYDTDFRQRVRAGDGFEFFFDIKEEEKGADGSLGELLATSITAGGETRKFYRFRQPDGSIDYYDENGDTSRRFLMRRPVRTDDVRLASGFGVRRHPVLQIPRMHTGIDWACAMGTPIMAAGTGVLEEVGRKGEYGNYIRIRHANGYKTAYGHMMRFAPGMAPGTKVRQGQIIGYVGTTGLSSGPHVHFEVLVNNTFVDPNAIQVPRERQLEGPQLAEFQRERQRIDELMRRNPVSTRLANVTGG
ncbi:MAG: M23 family metallopeptidase [Hyphomicrobiales bacterium]|nr:MAG: M23 family metallopeptidase [Hyphomicrobiales bacterium]